MSKKQRRKKFYRGEKEDSYEKAFLDDVESELYKNNSEDPIEYEEYEEEPEEEGYDYDKDDYFDHSKDEEPYDYDANRQEVTKLE